MKSPFAVNISSINGRPGNELDAEVEGKLESLNVSGSHVDSDLIIPFKGTLRSIDGGLQAEGRVQAKWVGECVRCLGPAGGSIDVHVREIFEREPTEGETYGIDGDYVDLEPLVREAIMLELPEAPLCSEDCKGLCAQCGANRNETDCGHTGAVTDLRWSALDALKEES